MSNNSDHTLAKGVMNSQAFWMTSTDIVGDMYPSEIDSDGVHVSTGNLFADGTKLVAGCKGFKKACVVAFAAGYSALLAESISEPRTPIVGINSLAVKIPYVPLEEEQYSVKLSDAAFKYYLMISRGSGLVTDPGPRLHLVSPCKATLTVEVSEEPVRCYFEKCVVPDSIMTQIKSDCENKGRRCEDELILNYKADNCGYATGINNLGQTKKIETKYPFYFFGNNLVEVKMNDEDMVLIDKVAPTDGLDYYRNRVDIYDEDAKYVDISIFNELKDARGTKICNTESVMEFTGGAVFDRVWNIFTFNREDFFGLDSYQITNVIRVTADKSDYGSNANYCHQGENKAYAYGRIVNMVGWAALDTVVASAASRFGPWGLAAAAGSQFVTGSASVVADQKLEDKSVTKWPGE